MHGKQNKVKAAVAIPFPFPRKLLRWGGFDDLADDFAGCGFVHCHHVDVQRAWFSPLATKTDTVFTKAVFQHLREGGVFANPYFLYSGRWIPPVSRSFNTGRAILRQIWNDVCAKNRTVYNSREELPCPLGVTVQHSQVIFWARHGEFKHKMIAARLNVIPDAGFAEKGQSLAKRGGIPASPNELQAIPFLCFGQWSTTQFLWNEFYPANRASVMTRAIFRVTNRAIF
jgi:hypothetical protein